MVSSEQTTCSDDANDQGLVEAYLDYLRKQCNYSPHTVRAYGADVRSYILHARRRGFDALHPDIRDVRDYLSSQMQARYSRRTINRRLSSLRTFFRWLNISQMSPSSAISAVQGPKIPKHLPRVLTEGEIDALFSLLEDDLTLGSGAMAEPSCGLDCGQPAAPLSIEQALSLRDAALFEVLYATGARVSEVAQLTLNQLDCAAGRIKIKGKGSKERYGLLHEQCVFVLTRYLESARPILLEKRKDGKTTLSDAVFLSKSGKALSADSIRKIFKEKSAQAGLDSSASPHAMRHTFATDMLNGGADLRSVQELLGHASLSTTQIYTHLTPDRLKKVHAMAHPRG